MEREQDRIQGRSKKVMNTQADQMTTQYRSLKLLWGKSWCVHAFIRASRLSHGPVGLRVAVGAREEIGGSMKFGGRDYEIMSTIEAILVCHLTL